MIYEVEVEDYQSLRRARIELGRFTVVTGHTGSGKSSLIRAIELLVKNARGTSYVRRGAKLCQVIMGLDDNTAVGIQRGQRGQDSYAIRVEDGCREKLYTKLGGKVPDDVAKLLRISNLNFAGQFDRPYLLDASGGEVARTLGELTNVTILLNAAREAQRRKNAVALKQRDVQARLDKAVQDAQRFKGLPARKNTVTSAEDALTAAHEVQVRLGRLEVLNGLLAEASARWREAPVWLNEIPDVDDLEYSQHHINRLGHLLKVIGSAEYFRAEAEQAAHLWDGRAQGADLKYRDTLKAAGVCPTCGRAVHG